MNDVNENMTGPENLSGRRYAAKSVPKIALKPALVVFFSMLAVVICLSAAAPV